MIQLHFKLPHVQKGTGSMHMYLYSFHISYHKYYVLLITNTTQNFHDISFRSLVQLWK